MWYMRTVPAGQLSKYKAGQIKRGQVEGMDIAKQIEKGVRALCINKKKSSQVRLHAKPVESDVCME